MKNLYIYNCYLEIGTLLTRTPLAPQRGEPPKHYAQRLKFKAQNKKELSSIKNKSLLTESCLSEAVGGVSSFS